MNTPPITPTSPSRVCDLVKHGYFVTCKEIADLQYKLAVLAGTGRLDPELSFDLQHHLFNLYDGLTSRLLRICDIADPNGDEDHYADGTKIVDKTVTDPEAERDWPWNEFCLGDGAVAEFPQGINGEIRCLPADFDE